MEGLTITESTTVNTTETANTTPTDSPTVAVPMRNGSTPFTARLKSNEDSNAVIVLFCRRPDISFLDFKHRFENDWVPCLEKVCGPLFPLTYVRRYLAHRQTDSLRETDGFLGLPSLMVGKEEDLLFDCLVEATFEDSLHMVQFFSLINEEEPASKLLECESTFSDIHKLKILIMENQVTVNKTRRLKTWE